MANREKHLNILFFGLKVQSETKLILWKHFFSLEALGVEQRGERDSEIENKNVLETKGGTGYYSATATTTKYTWEDAE